MRNFAVSYNIISFWNAFRCKMKRELAVALWIILTAAPAIAGKYAARTDMTTKSISNHSPWLTRNEEVILPHN